jgi:hypothetical protein
MKQATTGEHNITFPHRNLVKEVYGAAIADLDSALMLLPDNISEGRANRYAALGYLARIHFQMRDYASAAVYAQLVIEGPYSLNATPIDFFIDEGSHEEIWAVKENSQDNPGRNNSLTAYHNRNLRGGGEIRVSKDLDTNGFLKIISSVQEAALIQDSLTAVDLRSILFRNIQGNVLKYEDSGTTADDAPVQRLPEYMLILAEALARLDSNVINQQSLDLLNEIRTRSIRVFASDGTIVPNSVDYIGYKPGDLTYDELIEAIIRERRVELCFEGNRFHDLCRLQRHFRKVNYDDPKLRFPIPQREMDANPNLVQNHAYK